MGRAQHVIWPNQKTCILIIVTNNEAILSSMLAAGIVQDTFAGEAGEVGEAGEGELGRPSGDDRRLLYHPGQKFFPFRSNRISIANH